jgi:hypothetical protein
MSIYDFQSVKALAFFVFTIPDKIVIITVYIEQSQTPWLRSSYKIMEKNYFL